MLNRKLSDEEIVHTLQEGNWKYFTVLNERYEEHILSKCYGYVKDRDVSEDLCQEILLKIFFKIKDFKGTARFKTWLFAIIHNTCIDYLRKHKKNVPQIITSKMIDELPDLLIADDDIPVELSEQILAQLLEDISSEDKLLLLMKYKEKYSIQEIQQALNLSESAVKMRLKRAKERVNKLYDKLVEA